MSNYFKTIGKIIKNTENVLSADGVWAALCAEYVNQFKSPSFFSGPQLDHVELARMFVERQKAQIPMPSKSTEEDYFYGTLNAYFEHNKLEADGQFVHMLQMYLHCYPAYIPNLDKTILENLPSQKSALGNLKEIVDLMCGSNTDWVSYFIRVIANPKIVGNVESDKHKFDIIYHAIDTLKNHIENISDDKKTVLADLLMRKMKRSPHKVYMLKLLSKLSLHLTGSRKRKVAMVLVAEFSASSNYIFDSIFINDALTMSERLALIDKLIPLLNTDTHVIEILNTSIDVLSTGDEEINSKLVSKINTIDFFALKPTRLSTLTANANDLLKSIIVEQILDRARDEDTILKLRAIQSLGAIQAIIPAEKLSELVIELRINLCDSSSDVRSEAYKVLFSMKNIIPADEKKSVLAALLKLPINKGIYNIAIYAEMIAELAKAIPANDHPSLDSDQVNNLIKRIKDSRIHIASDAIIYLANYAAFIPIVKREEAIAALHDRNDLMTLDPFVLSQIFNFLPETLQAMLITRISIPDQRHFDAGNYFEHVACHVPMYEEAVLINSLKDLLNNANYIRNVITFIHKVPTENKSVIFNILFGFIEAPAIANSNLNPRAITVLNTLSSEISNTQKTIFIKKIIANLKIKKGDDLRNEVEALNQLHDFVQAEDAAQILLALIETCNSVGSFTQEKNVGKITSLRERLIEAFSNIIAFVPTELNLEEDAHEEARKPVTVARDLFSEIKMISESVIPQYHFKKSIKDTAIFYMAQYKLFDLLPVNERLEPAIMCLNILLLQVNAHQSLSSNSKPIKMLLDSIVNLANGLNQNQKNYFLYAKLFPLLEQNNPWLSLNAIEIIGRVCEESAFRSLMREHAPQIGSIEPLMQMVSAYRK